MKKISVLFICLLAVMAAGAPAKKEKSDHDHFDGPPHGGTPVQIGSHGFHLELVRDVQGKKFLAYVLDGHMEHYASVEEKSFEMVVKLEKAEHRLKFERVPEKGAASAGTKSHLFAAPAEWIKEAAKFKGEIPTITLNGKTFTNITFTFPKGSAHKH